MKLQFLVNNRRLIGRVLFVYTIALLLGTHLPKDAIADIHEHDKAIHFVAYLGLSLLTFAYVTTRTGKLDKTFYGSIVALVLFAALDEFTQQFSPGRISDVGDWLADCAGVVTGTSVWYAQLKRIAAEGLGLPDAKSVS